MMDFSYIIKNNLRDHLVVSNYDKKSFENVELCLGIDEAGRGPVLGSFVLLILILIYKKFSFFLKNSFLIQAQWFTALYSVP